MNLSSDVSQERFTEHYGVLRGMARARLRAHKPFTLLGTTELVHESFLKLTAGSALCPQDQSAFLGYVSLVMRSVIVDAARQRLAQRRGEDADHVDIDDLADSVAESPAQEIVRVHDALQALKQSQVRMAQILELEYFAGMSEAEIAQCLGLSERTIRREAHKGHLILRALLS
ncbi:MAG: hypothetical protein CFE44_13215 [Burkholderiales bacterium PBB4]|nr:MAG: hypothetical protein CFE44_13215 [Burkholderiales bacterium PBB4]